MKPLHLVLAALFLAVLPALAGGKKDPDAHIAFHIETTPGGNPRMVFQHPIGGEQRDFRRVPEVTSKDIAAFNPFPSQDGQGYGVLLQLKPGAVNRLSGITASNIGKWMVARLNGRIVDAVKIDRQISDGKLVIWKNVALADVQALDEEFPRFGEDKPRR